jgi:periplasmic copper chaperone A
MRRVRALAVGAALSAAALIGLAGPASAHVTISAPGATRGGSDQEITFRVPVEKEVDTVGLRVQLPTDRPIAAVEVQALAGWTHTEKTVKLAKPITTDDGDITEAVSEIDWTATAGQGIHPGEFGAFTIIAGQLPDAPTLTFKAIQVYRDGTEARWIETAAPGSDTEPQDPAPVLSLAPATAAASTASAEPAAATSHQAKVSNTGPVVLSVLALVVAAAALGLAVVSRARRGHG